MIKCNQCGMIHPPLPIGTDCPNAPAKTSSGIEIVGIADFFAILKTTLIVNIEKKEIKDSEKLFKNLTMEVVKFMENYQE